MVGEQLNKLTSVCVSAHVYRAPEGEIKTDILKQRCRRKRTMKPWPLTSTIRRGVELSGGGGTKLLEWVSDE